MQLLVMCEHCKTYTLIKSDNVGHSVDMSSWINYEVSWEVDNTSDLEEMDSISEDDVEVDHIKAQLICRGCGEFLILEFPK